jgi:hypothetical protein
VVAVRLEDIPHTREVLAKVGKQHGVHDPQRLCKCRHWWRGDDRARWDAEHLGRAKFGGSGLAGVTGDFTGAVGAFDGLAPGPSRASCCPRRSPPASRT